MSVKNLLISGLAIIGVAFSSMATAADHTIKAGARAFETPILYMAAGDNVAFTNMNSHNTVTVDELVPEGGKTWASGMGENLALTLDVPGIYSYVCQPHIGFGMVGVIVVGDVSADDVAAYKQKAMDTLQGPYRRLLGKINKIEPTI